jgi:hypothetical protein
MFYVLMYKDNSLVTNDLPSTLLMPEDLWATLVPRKQSKCWLIISFGQRCGEMWSDMFFVA